MKYKNINAFFRLFCCGQFNWLSVVYYRVCVPKQIISRRFFLMMLLTHLIALIPFFKTKGVKRTIPINSVLWYRFRPTIEAYLSMFKQQVVKNSPTPRLRLDEDLGHAHPVTKFLGTRINRQWRRCKRLKRKSGIPSLLYVSKKNYDG